jgi:hypothetical protein
MPQPVSRLAGHLLVECLVAQGVTHVFGVPGESYLAALDGFHALGDRIRSSPTGKRAAPPSWPKRTASSPAGPVCVL